MTKKAEEILTALKAANNILLVTHHNPDADAIGSVLGLYGVLTHQLGKQVSMAIDGEVPQNLAYLPYFFRITDGFRPEKFDTVVILDCSGWSRTNFFETDELSIDWPEQTIVIDHHITQGTTPGIQFIDSQASSASELVWRLVKEWRLPTTPEVATCLLTGISADTGSFQHTNTQAETFRAAAELMLAGASLNKIVSGIYLGKSTARLKLWGRVLQRMKYDHTRKLAVSVATQEDLDECKANRTDLTGLVNLMATLPDTKFVLLLTETPEGELKGSLRTEDDNIDVRKLAEILGGGGHIKAAGFELPAKIQINGSVWTVI